MLDTMTQVRHITLDVLKPHHPTILELASAIAALAGDYYVNVTVQTVDEKTESVLIAIDGTNIDMAALDETIRGLGAAIHSVDKVEVVGAEL
jgi:hypothetical protein